MTTEHDFDGHGGCAPGCRQCRIEEQAATIARLERERDTGKAFHDVAVKERDYERRMRDKAEAERDALTARLAELEARLANRRMCVTCGQYAPEGARRTDVNPACTSGDGWNPCLFDMTPEEAWQHWRALAHHAAERIRDLEANRAAPRVTCSICRRDDCGGDHPCE